MRALALVMACGLAMVTPPEGAVPPVAPGAAPGVVPAEGPRGTKDTKGPAAITAQSLLTLVRELPTKRSPVGSPEHVAGLRATEEWALAKIKALGYEPTVHEIFWKPRPEKQEKKPEAEGPAPEGDGEKPVRWRNFTFEIPGRGGAVGAADGKKAEEVVLISAHLDAVAASPGADDDGSGVSAVLEIARVLKGKPMQRTVRFALFNLEEIGLVGSTQYAQGVADKGEPVVLMVSLEMLGFYSAEKGSQINPFPAFKGLDIPTTGDFIGLGTVLRHREVVRAFAAAMTAAEPACKVFVLDHSPIAPPDMLRSDHAPFLLRGMPGVMCTDTANFRNPHYHKATDTVETLDGERFAATVRGVVGGIRGIAGE